jgi:hypothetical protein
LRLFAFICGHNIFKKAIFGFYNTLMWERGRSKIDSHAQKFMDYVACHVSKWQATISVELEIIHIVFLNGSQSIRDMRHGCERHHHKLKNGCGCWGRRGYSILGPVANSPGLVGVPFDRLGRENSPHVEPVSKSLVPPAALDLIAS